MSIIGITMGCPTGIGPEIILRYFNSNVRKSAFSPVVLGDPGILAKCSEQLDIPARIVTWQPGDEILQEGIPVMPLSDVKDHQWGKPTEVSAHAMVKYIHTGVRLAQDGHLDAITTCPIAKDALQKAGYNYPGHTEMLVELTKAKRYTMMMAGPTLRVTLATIHCSLSDVPQKLNKKDLTALIDITDLALKMDFGLQRPRIAVAGLNPHAGESGIFGREEQMIISPAIQSAVEQSYDVKGPFPPDTVFFKAANGDFDCVICMYHDQGLIPFKLLHFKDGVNVTLGLPIVRTSVDHGTAYDIAGKGLADAESLAAAVALAHEIQFNRKQYNKTL